MNPPSVLQPENMHSLYLVSHPLEGYEGEDSAGAVRRFLSEMKKEGAKTIVVLLESAEIEDLYKEIDLLQVYRTHDFEVLHFPFKYSRVPENMEHFDEFISSIVQRLKSRNILAHCKTGCGRTGMIAAGVLIKLGWDTESAIEHIRDIRPGSLEVVKQLLFLRNYHKFLQIRNNQ